ncbi:MAG: DUF4349 domain-containing protein, partial [Gaiellaceae bacterium]
MSRPEIEQDERFLGLVRELQSHRPEPSAELEARIEQIAARTAEPARPERRNLFAGRRLLLALGGVALLAALAGAVVLGGRGNGNLAAQRNTALKTTAGSVLGTSTVSQAPGAPASVFSAQDARHSAAPKATSTAGSGSERQPVSPLATGKRLAELHAELTLRVASQLELSRATGRAERIVRSSGGYIANASYNSGASDGSSFLELKVPAARAQSVLGRLSALGQLLAQNVSLQDLQATVDGQTRSIRVLQAQISELVRSLDDTSLSSQARDQLKVQLALKRSQLKGLVLARRETRARGVYATISLTLTTGRAKAVVPPGRIHKAFDDARGGLAREIAWVVRGAVVGAPLILLVALLLLGARQR